MIKNILQRSDSDTLIIFDVDEVLLYPVDEILRRKHQKELFEIFIKFFDKYFTEKRLQELYSIVFLERKIIPVSIKLALLIRKIQKQNIKILALTHCYTEDFGRISRMKDWRIKELETLGYYFKLSWPEINEIKFDKLPTIDEGKYAAFKEGIIFTYNLSKEIVLKEFFKSFAMIFTKIIFIDDIEENLNCLEKFAQEVSVDYTRIHYTAVEDMFLTSLDQNIIERQCQVLIKEKKWISDAEITSNLGLKY